MKTDLGREEWYDVLGKLADTLGDGPEVRLCLIGSAACIFGGMDGRTSHDLDIWKPASDYDRRELATAAERIGLLFDPKSHLEPGRPYLQLVDPIPSELGDFTPVFFERMGRLRLFRPPIENLIVSKLIRCEPRDLSDIRFMMECFRPSRKAIAALVETLTEANRSVAKENLIYLQIL